MAKKKGKRPQGEGSVYQRKDGKWECKIPVGKDPSTGKLKRKSFYGASQEEVRKKRDEYLTQKRTGTYIEPSKLTVGPFVGDWLKVFVKPNKKAATYAKYESVYLTHINKDLGNIELQKLTTMKVQEFYNTKAAKLSSSAVSIIHIVLHGAMEYAVEEKLIPKNPTSKTKRPSVKHKEVVVMTEEELQKYLLAAKEYRMFAAFFTALTTGLRRGELCALRWKHIDFKKEILKVRESLNRVQVERGKTELRIDTLKTDNAKRDIPLLPETIKILKDHREKQKKERQDIEGENKVVELKDNSLVFCTEEGKFYEPRNLLRLHKVILKKAGLRTDIKIHTLRHQFATMLLKKNVNLKYIIDLLGHADERMVLRTYGHSDDQDLKNAILELKDVIKA